MGLDVTDTLFGHERELAQLTTRVDQIAEGQDRIESKVDLVLEKLGKQDDRIIALEGAEDRRKAALTKLWGVTAGIVIALGALVIRAVVGL